MNQLFLVMICFVALQAKSYQCPRAVSRGNSEYQFIKKLENHRGQFKLGSCRIEIDTCDVTESQDGASEFAGDILVTDALGFVRYIPIFFVEYSDRKTKSVTRVNTNTLLYRFKDKNYDPKSGRFEKWAVEIQHEPNGRLGYLEISFKNQQQRFSSSAKRWVVCGYEREKQYELFPLFHTMRSWWTWITKT